LFTKLLKGKRNINSKALNRLLSSETTPINCLFDNNKILIEIS